MTSDDSYKGITGLWLATTTPDLELWWSMTSEVAIPVFSGDCITPPSMVKCTSVGEIEEEDGTITVAHPSSIVMTTYFMGLGHYTIVMG